MRARGTTIALVVTLVVVACDGTGAYVYYARRYDDPRDCLEKVEALDVMSGTDPGLGCAPHCLVVKDPDAGLVLYGTTECGPTPFGAIAEGDPRCAAVRAAVAASNVCTPDSGIKEAGTDAPAEAATEAGTDADAGADAGVDADAGADAAADAPSE